MDDFIKQHVTVSIPLDRVNADYDKASDTLNSWKKKSCLRKCSKLLKDWDENLFGSYFEIDTIPNSELSRFKQVVTNYLTNVIRFGFREFVELKRGSWTLSKNGNIYFSLNKIFIVS